MTGDYPEGGYQGIADVAARFGENREILIKAIPELPAEPLVVVPYDSVGRYGGESDVYVANLRRQCPAWPDSVIHTDDRTPRRPLSDRSGSRLLRA